MIEVIKRLGGGGPARRAPRLVISMSSGADVDDEIVAAIALALALDERAETPTHGGDTSLWVLSGRIQQLNRSPRF